MVYNSYWVSRLICILWDWSLGDYSTEHKSLDTLAHGVLSYSHSYAMCSSMASDLAETDSANITLRLWISLHNSWVMGFSSLL